MSRYWQVIFSPLLVTTEPLLSKAASTFAKNSSATNGSQPPRVRALPGSSRRFRNRAGSATSVAAFLKSQRKSRWLSHGGALPFGAVTSRIGK